MKTNDSISGVFPVLPTVFDNAGLIDPSGMRAVLEYVIAAGADGVVFPGLASEYDQLSKAERLDLVSNLGKWIDGRIPFVVGASAGTPEDASLYAQNGADAGAGAAMIMTPGAFADQPGRMIDFYHNVGSVTGIPIMLQNAPKPMGVGLSVAEVANLVKGVSEIAYIKEETSPSGQRITALLDQRLPSLQGVFGGAGGRYIIDELNRGSHGNMPACEVTEIHAALFAAHKCGDVNTARHLFERSLPLLNMQAIFRWRLTKAVLFTRGLINSTYVRAPGPQLDKQDRRELSAMLDLIGDLTDIAQTADR
ncbi:dihydrodipicolinate synthase family protein [Exilibacterium tricleocarpae]|uniref:Dihydrodipicolinate synthase family protein n=1 Tax=Exilibacterium tricleocarpae TaxID=2591008 RepID=A0A545T015_9GAMM|nr:dihydrodipicolinate synthase family protein [Exilibacterium tricleocarpae]TQV70550.1 dihydrodipicolinate synthase family protein [Exilibacterium tricleocarpae]